MTPHFSLRELTFSATAAARNIDNTPGPDALESLGRLALDVLEPLREAFGAPLTVTSGFRSKALNAALKGAVNSQHLAGEAADLVASCLPGESRKQANKRLFNLAVSLIDSGELKVGQLIDEKGYSWIHISLPSSRHLNHVLHL